MIRPTPAQSAYLRQLAGQMREVAASVGPMHAWWDTIANMEALADGKVGTPYGREWMIEEIINEAEQALAAHRGKSTQQPVHVRAYDLACRAHAGQTRRDGVTPYMEHIRAVMARAPNDPISQSVAALHDTIEDKRLTLDDLADFPAEVRSGVDALTRRANETYGDFIRRIVETDNARWAPVKIADILANLSDSPTTGQIKKYARALLYLTGDETY